MNLKPVIIGVQVITLLMIFSMMRRYGVTEYNIIGAVIMGIVIVVNIVVELGKRKK